MRILIQTFGSAGDVHPYVGLGAALLARGHEVLVFANSVFEETVRASGVRYVECGRFEDVEHLSQNPDLWHPQRGIELIMKEAVVPALEPAYQTIAPHVVPGETVIVASSLSMSAHALAEVGRLPLVIAHLAPMAFPSIHRAPHYVGVPDLNRAPRVLRRLFYWVFDRMGDGMIGRQLNAFRASHGLPAIRRIFSEWFHEADLCLGMFPDWFAAPQPDWPEVTLTGFPLYDEGEQEPLAPEVEDWLAQGEPPLVFTAGSAHLFGQAYYRASIEAAADLGRRAILVTRATDVLPDPLPDHALHLEYVPFSRLFRRAAAVVHHGGVGTMSQCLAAGVPHVAAYMGFDQADNASRMKELGVGAGLAMNRYNRRRAASLLGQLLDDPAVTDACAGVAERMRQERPRESACEAIEQMAARRFGERAS